MRAIFKHTSDRDGGFIFRSSGPYPIRCFSKYLPHNPHRKPAIKTLRNCSGGVSVILFFSFEVCIWKIVSRVRAQGKNVEILHAVEDLIKIIRAHPIYDHLESVSEEEVTKLKKHYNHFMYQVRLRRDVQV